MDSTLVTTMPLFAEVPRRRRTRVAGLVDVADVAAGAVVVRQGAYARELFAVLDGDADVLVDGRRVGRVGPGEVFGELGVLAGYRRTATVVARTPMRLAVVAGRELAALLHEFPSVDRRVRAAAASRTVPAPTTPAAPAA